MNNFLNDIPLLVEVARRKSFTKAAEILGIGASTLSRRIRLLEKNMGVSLFFRDTRNVDLTPNGALLLDRCEFILQETRKAYDAVVLNMREPSGLLRICMFKDVYDERLKTALCRFADDFPDIQIQLTFVEHPVDLRTAPYDVAFLIEPSIAPPLVARKLLTVQPFLYASPELFKRRPMPAEPHDLHKFPCIVLERIGCRWTLSKGERQTTLEIQPAYVFSSVAPCRDFALAGRGIAMLREVTASPDEKAGRLVRVLPEWNGFRHDLKLVTAPGQLPQRVHAFVDHIVTDYLSLRNSL
jgi:DNA-binding transcriptional LysR family regulator